MSRRLGVAAVLVAAACVRPPPLYVGPPNTTATSVKITVTASGWTVPVLQRLRSTVALNGGESITEDVAQGPVTLPFTYFVLVDSVRYPLILPSGRSGTLDVAVDAFEGSDGVATWHKQVSASVESGTLTAVEVRLGPACDGPEACADKDSDADPCNLFPVCTAGTCILEPACPPLNVACVDGVECVPMDGRPQCSYHPNNALCEPIPAPDNEEPTYCDAVRGCIPGSPCARDTDCEARTCQDATCVSGRCVYGLPRDFDDGKPCTSDICPLELGRPVHPPLPTGTPCQLANVANAVCAPSGDCVAAACGDGITTEGAGEDALDEGAASAANPHDGIHLCHTVRYEPRVLSAVRDVDAMALDANPVALAVQWLTGAGLRLWVALDDGRLLVQQDGVTRWVAGSPVPGKVGSQANPPRGQVFGRVVDMAITTEGYAQIVHTVGGQLYLSTYKDGQLTREPRTETGVTSVLGLGTSRIMLGTSEGVLALDPTRVSYWPGLTDVQAMIKTGALLNALGMAPVDGGVQAATLTLVTGVMPARFVTEFIPTAVCTTPTSFAALGLRVATGAMASSTLDTLLVGCDNGSLWKRTRNPDVWAQVMDAPEVLMLDSAPEIRSGGMDVDHAFAITRSNGRYAVQEVAETGMLAPVFQTAPAPANVDALAQGVRCPGSIAAGAGQTWVVEQERVLSVMDARVSGLAGVVGTPVQVLRSAAGVSVVTSAEMAEWSGAGVKGTALPLDALLTADEDVQGAANVASGTWLLVSGGAGWRLQQVDAPQTQVPLAGAPLGLAAALETLYVLGNNEVLPFEADGTALPAVAAPGARLLVNGDVAAPALLRAPAMPSAAWELDCLLLQSGCQSMAVTLPAGPVPTAATLVGGVLHLTLSDGTCLPGGGRVLALNAAGAPLVELGMMRRSGPFEVGSPSGLAWDDLGLWVADLGLDALALVPRTGEVTQALAQHSAWLEAQVLAGPTGMTRHADGGLLLALSEANTISRIELDGGVMLGPPLLGNGARVPNYAPVCAPRSPTPTAPAGLSHEDGTLYVAEPPDSTVARLMPGSQATLRDFSIGRGCLPGSTGDRLNGPKAVVVRDGVVLVADTENNRVLRYVNAIGPPPDAGPQPPIIPDILVGPYESAPLSSPVYRPSALAVDGNGNVWVATSSAVFILVGALHAPVPAGGFTPLLAYNASASVGAGPPCLTSLALEPGCGPHCRIYVADGCRGEVVELTHRWTGDTPP